MRIRFLIALLTAAIALPAAALDERALLTEYAGLTKVLLSYGVDASTVDWGPIEPMCLGLKTEESMVNYNECKLEKALDQRSWHDDSSVCDNESHALYPQASPEYIIQHQGADNKTDTTTITQAPLYTNDLNAARQYVFDRCIHDKGWRSSRDWRLGINR